MKLKYILLILPFLFGCNRNDAIKKYQNNEEGVIIENHKYTDDEKLIFNIILEKGNKSRWISDEEEEDEDIFFLVERNYILYDDSRNENTANYLRSQNIEISNICFNKEMNKAIVYFNINFGTVPSSFISGDFYYIIFEKNNNEWKQIGHTNIWSGIS